MMQRLNKAVAKAELGCHTFCLQMKSCNALHACSAWDLKLGTLAMDYLALPITSSNTAAPTSMQQRPHLSSTAVLNACFTGILDNLCHYLLVIELLQQDCHAAALQLSQLKSCLPHLKSILASISALGRVAAKAAQSPGTAAASANETISGAIHWGLAGAYISLLHADCRIHEPLTTYCSSRRMDVSYLCHLIINMLRLPSWCPLQCLSMWCRS
jgi:hypothetical protein